MKSEEIRYVAGCVRHGINTLEGDSKLANRAYQGLIRALKDLRKRPDKGVEFLTDLLSHEDLSVVAWAASHLLPYKENEAIYALGKVASSDVRLVSFDAEMTLREWRAGRLKVE